MNKKMIFLIISSLLIAISCGFRKQKAQENKSATLSSASNYQTIKPAVPETPPPVLEPPKELPEPPAPSPALAEIKSHYDSKKLDSRVLELAQKFGRNPSTYRLPLSDQADGTNVYREVGTHVLMNPDGDETHLPDEI